MVSIGAFEPPGPEVEYIVTHDRAERPGSPRGRSWALVWVLACLVAWVILGLAFIGLLAVIGWGPGLPR